MVWVPGLLDMPNWRTPVNSSRWSRQAHANLAALANLATIEVYELGELDVLPQPDVRSYALIFVHS